MSPRYILAGVAAAAAGWWLLRRRAVVGSDGQIECPPGTHPSQDHRNGAGGRVSCEPIVDSSLPPGVQPVPTDGWGQDSGPRPSPSEAGGYRLDPGPPPHWVRGGADDPPFGARPLGGPREVSPLAPLLTAITVPGRSR